MSEVENVTRWRRIRAGSYAKGPWAVFRDPATHGPWYVWKKSELLKRPESYSTASMAKTACEMENGGERS